LRIHCEGAGSWGVTARFFSFCTGLDNGS
jgi:hypothetical protein